MKTKRMAVGALVVATLACGIGYRIKHPTVTVLDVHVKAHSLPSPVVEAQLPEAPRTTPPPLAVAAHAAAVPAAAPPAAREPGAPPEVDGHRLIEQLGRHTDLSDQQRADLDRVLRLVASMQERIDLHDDPAQRQDLQDKLLHQLVLRLRMIVGEDNVQETAVALTDGKPRIRYE